MNIGLRTLYDTPSVENLTDKKNCNLFSSFSFMVQSILGVMSFMVLIIKRYKETPRRPWKIFFLDVSKQFVSVTCVHLMNLFIALFLSGDNNTDKKTDECMWYFINLLVDTTLGTFIIYALMRIIDRQAKEQKIGDLKSGLYYEKYVKDGKTRFRWKPKMYFIQLFIWTSIVTLAKLFLLAFTKLFSFFLERVGTFIMKPFIVNDKLELIIVLVVFPFILNSLQFWIFDNILKLPPEEEKEIQDENVINGVDINNLNKITDDQISQHDIEKDALDYKPPKLSSENLDETAEIQSHESINESIPNHETKEKFND